MDIKLKEISESNDFDFYYNATNVRDQDFVLKTVEYFESGKRAGFFEPLDFLNLFWKQFNFFDDNVSKPFSTINSLRSLPISEEQKHILYGFILKFYGGYPIQKNPFQHSSTLRLLERVFLSFEGETAEK